LPGLYFSGIQVSTSSFLYVVLPVFMSAMENISHLAILLTLLGSTYFLSALNTGPSHMRKQQQAPGVISIKPVNKSKGRRRAPLQTSGGRSVEG